MSLQNDKIGLVLGEHSTGWLLAIIGGLLSLLIGFIGYSVNEITDDFERSVARVAGRIQDHEQRIRTLEQAIGEMKMVSAGRRATNELEISNIKDRLNRMEKR